MKKKRKYTKRKTKTYTPIPLIPNRNHPLTEKAIDLIEGDRQKTHGDFNDNFARAAQIFEAWTGKRVEPNDIPKMMQCVKMAREHANPKEAEHYVDQIGYTELRARMNVSKRGRPKKK